MLVQRRRLWADVVKMLHKCFVFTGMTVLTMYVNIHAISMTCTAISPASVRTHFLYIYFIISFVFCSKFIKSKLWLSKHFMLQVFLNKSYILASCLRVYSVADPGIDRRGGGGILQ